jgi:hypothetical protein
MDNGPALVFKTLIYITNNKIYKMLAGCIFMNVILIKIFSLLIQKFNLKVFKGFWKSYNHMIRKNN